LNLQAQTSSSLHCRAFAKRVRREWEALQQLPPAIWVRAYESRCATAGKAPVNWQSRWLRALLACSVDTLTRFLPACGARAWHVGEALSEPQAWGVAQSAVSLCCRTDLFRAAMAGPAGTPYHDGLFFFDIKLPASYPATPPQARVRLSCVLPCLFFVKATRFPTVKVVTCCCCCSHRCHTCVVTLRAVRCPTARRMRHPRHAAGDATCPSTALQLHMVVRRCGTARGACA
jgi:Ubiquitin-conjugating enzyme